jgi:7-cyano-7-deazaguanine reductase
MPEQDDPALTQLGHAIPWPQSPEEATLERVAAPGQGKAYMVRFAAPEFTSLCPITGQPDFAHIVIDYVPARWLVESKSLVDLLAPVWLRIGAYWYPRGGIPIDVFWQTGTPPDGVWIPDQGVPGYRGRG